MGRILPRDFYDRATETVAQELLGCILECRTPEGTAGGIIVETEAYVGEHDEACHAAAGLTKRTAPLYGPAGVSYVYFIYGVHWCFNAVTRKEGLPSAVLVRALEPVSGLRLMKDRRGEPARDTDLTNGPGKLCEALGITGALNGLPLQKQPLVIREGQRITSDGIETTPRIGITRAVDWPLRYFIRDNRYVSRFPRARTPRLRLKP
jgi:DNA-3-methyladenine glycosylase